MNPVLPHCVVSSGKVGALREKLSQWIDGRLDLPASEILVDYVSKKFARSVITEKLKAFLNLNVAAR